MENSGSDYLVLNILMFKNSKINTVVILAGGLGTRLSEETQKKPKPMVKIGGMPILWHIMKLYSYLEKVTDV
mgnify:CR=1 FL=1